ncbi:hypothetical protein ACOMHN_016085 [Nucella lapillus]
MLMELCLEHYPERYDEVVAWRENSGFTMDSAVKVPGQKHVVRKETGVTVDSTQATRVERPNSRRMSSC